MKRFQQEITPTDKDGNVVNPTAQSNAGRSTSNNYAAVEPGFYNAVVTEIDMGDPYRAGAKGFPNPNASDGKWNYEKIVPQFTLLNSEGTKIGRQDFTLGVYESNKFIRPDGKKQSPIWAGTQFLLTALGLFTADPENPEKFKMDVNFTLVKDRVIRVKTGLAGYIKTPRLNLDGGALDKVLSKVIGTPKYTFEQALAAVEKINEMTAPQLNDLPGFTPELVEKIMDQRLSEKPDDAKLVLKNVVVSAYPLTEAEAEENGWFYEKATGSVFTTAAAWEEYIRLDDEDRNYTEPDM